MSAHTPTPWRQGKSFPEFVIGCEEPDGRIIADLGGHRDVAFANAEYIVRAVNNHEELLEALKWAMGTGRLTYMRRNSANGSYCDAVDRARAAIAKAEVFG